MRNLLILAERLAQLPLEALADAAAVEAEIAGTAPADGTAAAQGLAVAAVAFDAPSATLMLVSAGPAPVFLSYSLSRRCVQSCVSLAPYLHGEESGDRVVALHYLAELEQAVLACAKGSLLTVGLGGPPDEPPFISRDVGEPVRGGGIAAMAWSPDDELCALLLLGDEDGSGAQLQLRTKELDVMYETPLFPGAAMPSAAVSAAYARFGTASLSWRGDGQYFVVNALDMRPTAAASGQHPQRFTIVFDRQLERQSCSAGMKAEPLDGSSDGLGVALSWRPSGNLYFGAANRYISAQLTKHELFAFERNGLRHGEIPLGNVVPAALSSSPQPAGPSLAAAAAKKPAARRRPAKGGDDEEEDDGAAEDDDAPDERAAEAAEDARTDGATASSARRMRVLDLQWNADSDVFAVRMEDAQSGAQSVLLYSIGNYHWYLKQELRPSVAFGPDGRPTQLWCLWAGEDARRLLLVESSGLVRSVELVWDNIVSENAQARTCGVIDGQALLLTPLAKQVVPPPMCSWKLLLDPSVGRASGISFRASPLGAELLAKGGVGAARFSMPNQVHEAAAFVSDEMLPLPPPTEHDDDDVPVSTVPRPVLPPSASPALFSPTSDMLVHTSARRVFLIENVEELCGNGMTGPAGINLTALVARASAASASSSASKTARGFVHEFPLDDPSGDFPLGQVRDLHWLDDAEGCIGDAEDDASSPRSRVREDHPATVLCVEAGLAGQSDQLVEMEVFDGAVQGMFRTPLPQGHAVLRLAVQKQLGHVFVQLTSGRVLRYLPASWQPWLPLDDRVPILEGLGSSASDNAGASTPVGSLALPCPCPWFSVVPLGGVLHPLGRDVLGKLFVSSSLLTPQCSSFLARQHPLYVLFTILGQQNAGFLLDKRLSLEVNCSEAHRADPHAVRLLERGSALLAVVPSLAAPRFIVQLPRGNLEAVYPRALTLAALNTALSSLRFPEAFDSVRRNRIDPNLIVDHFGLNNQHSSAEAVASTGSNFRAVAAELVDQILSIPGAGRGVELLNLLISALTEESSLENQYVAYKPLPLTAEARDMLARRAVGQQGGSSVAAGSSAMEAIREKLRQSAAARAAIGAGDGDGAAAAGGADGGASDLDSEAGDAGVGLQPHDAVGEDAASAPYNYVPRKPGQPRRPHAKSKAERERDGAGLRSREEARRAREAAERLERESLAAAYEASLAATIEAEGGATQSKVNTVCAVLRAVLLSRSDRDALTLCVLTTYLRSEPKQYDEALALVKAMRDKEKKQQQQQGVQSVPSGVSSASAAVAAAAASRAKESGSLENKSASYAGYRGALQYMIFLSDVEVLYEAALGLYDFELVRLVAQYSHMDPKEYVQFIDQLEQMNAPDESEEEKGKKVVVTAAEATASKRVRRPHFQRYSIDLHLGRWSKALASLLSAWRSGEIVHDEAHWNNLVMSLLRAHPELYLQAIDTMTPEKLRDVTRLPSGGGGGGGGGRFGGFGGDGHRAPFDPTGGLPAHFLNPSLAPSASSSLMSFGATTRGASSSSSSASSATPAAEQSDEMTPYNALLIAYAEHAASSNPHAAANAFLLACEYDRALKALQSAGDWKECMSLAHQLKFDQHQLQQLAYDLANQLRSESKTAVAAAQLLVDYCDDVDEAVVVLLSGEAWSETMRLCYSKGREDLLETNLQPELIKAYNTHLKHVQSHRARYAYAIGRLRLIRRMKLLFPPAADVGASGVVGGERNERDDDLQSIVSGVTTSTLASGASRASQSSAVSAFSGRSTATVASTSSLFSIATDTRRELTPDERRIARHADKLRRRNANKRVKEGSLFEEDMMLAELTQTTPLDKHKARISALIHALLGVGLAHQARTLQAEFASLLALVAAEEAKPMPMMENPTPEQRRALEAFWDWPDCVHPERKKKDNNKDEQLVLPFLFPPPSAKAAKEAAAAAATVAKGAAGSSSNAAAASSSSGAASAAAAPSVEESADDDGDMLGGLM